MEILALPVRQGVFQCTCIYALLLVQYCKLLRSLTAF